MGLIALAESLNIFVLLGLLILTIATSYWLGFQVGAYRITKDCASRIDELDERLRDGI